MSFLLFICWTSYMLWNIFCELQIPDIELNIFEVSAYQYQTGEWWPNDGTIGLSNIDTKLKLVWLDKEYGTAIFHPPCPTPGGGGHSPYPNMYGILGEFNFWLFF
jgi:hypothetical protein